MRRPVTIILASMALISQLRSQEAISPELARLKTGYQAAVTKAVTPLTATYRRELERLLETFTRSGKLDQALQVKKEIETLDGVALARSGQKAQVADDAPVPPPPIASVEGTAWVSPTGYVERFEFQAGGKIVVTSREKKTFVSWTYQQAQDGSLMIIPSGQNAIPGVFRYTKKGATYTEGSNKTLHNFKLDDGRSK